MVWLEEIRERLQALMALPAGWDGYSSPPVSPGVAAFALDIIEQCCTHETPPPSIVPGSSGTLQIEWHLERGDMELFIVAPGEVDAWYKDRSTGPNGVEAPLLTDFTLLKKWLSEVRCGEDS